MSGYMSDYIWKYKRLCNRLYFLPAYEAFGEYGLISFQLGSIFQLPSNYINLFISHW